MLIPSANVGLPAQVPATGNISSSIITTSGLTRGAVGMKSSQAVTLSVQRYIDAAALVPLGAAITVALTANVANSVNWTDGAPANSIVITVSNAGGTAANLSNVAVAFSP